MMRLKSIALDQMERCMCGKREVNPYLTKLLYLQSNMEEGITLWYGAVWAGMLWERL